MSSAAVAPDMKAEEAHAHICAKYGTFDVEKGVQSHLWGGAGNYIVDTVGSRNFERYRDEIDRLGQEHGCHTCGRFKGSVTPPPNANTGDPMLHWVCDHQPPLGIIPDATEWHLYPQCHDCSNKQRGQSIKYVHSFTKHVGSAPNKNHQHLFWGQGRAHRPTANYAADYSKGGTKLDPNKDDKMNE